MMEKILFIIAVVICVLSTGIAIVTMQYSPNIICKLMDGRMTSGSCDLNRGINPDSECLINKYTCLEKSLEVTWNHLSGIFPFKEISKCNQKYQC